MVAYKRIIELIEDLHSPVEHCEVCQVLVCDECDSKIHDNLSWKFKYPCKTIELIQEEAGNV